MQEHKFRRRAGIGGDRCIVQLTQDDAATQPLRRSLAACHWGTQLAIPAQLARAARLVQARTLADEAHHNWYSLMSNNVANVELPSGRGASHAALRADVQQLLDRFTPGLQVRGALWLACHEVLFHVDEALAEEAAFVVWHVGGPAKVVDFPNMGFGVTMQMGDALLFDGMQPHGVCLPRYAGRSFPRREGTTLRKPPASPEDVTVFYSIDVELTPTLEDLLQIRREFGPETGLHIEVDEQSGRSMYKAYTD